MANSRNNGSFNPTLLTLAATCVVVAALSLARTVLIPFSLAILLSFLLSPAVDWLERHNLRRGLAVVVVVLVVFSLLGGIGWVVGKQIGQLVEQWPQERQRINNKIDSVREYGRHVLSKFALTANDIRHNLAATQPVTPVAVRGPDTTGPVQVVQVEPQAAPLERILSLLGSLFGPLGTAGIIVVLVIFILLHRENVRDRLVRLMGKGKFTLTTQAMNDASRRVSRYLLAQSLVNSGFGVITGLGLFFIGVPNALLWGFLGAILRFVPYIGPWIAAALPTALSLAVSDSWARPLFCVGLYVVVEICINSIVEPWFYGHSAGLSPVAILFAAVFWTWLWGPVGLVMATPLTVCLMVIGKYVPPMNFLHVLLSDEQVLEPEERFYQRLLAEDENEAWELASEMLKKTDLRTVYNRLLIPVLLLAEKDRHNGALSEPRSDFLFQMMRRMVDGLAQDYLKQDFQERHKTDSDAPAIPPRPQLASVTCLPANDAADEIAALMLHHLLEPKGYNVQTFSAEALSGEMLQHAQESGASIFCIIALPPAAALHASYLCRQLRQRLPESKILVGLWGARGDTRRMEQRLKDSGADQYCASIDALEQRIHETMVSIGDTKAKSISTK